MREDSEVTLSEGKPVVRLRVTPKPKTAMGDGGMDLPFIRLRASVKPKTEMGDGGGWAPVRLHMVRQG